MAPLPQVPEPRFEPCASTGSYFLYAQGSVVVCLHHDTLAVERRFELHQDDIYLISVDNLSERGAGRLVVSYDVGQTAIVWDLFTGSEITRFTSFDSLLVAAWMRNGNLAFGSEKGDILLFEPSTSEHMSSRTIFDPITSLAPSSDCRTFAIGYQNGSILLVALNPTFTILHTLSASKDPSPIVGLTWHASSPKQKSDMLASQASYGDLRVWSVSKPPDKATPKTIRILKRSDSVIYLGPKWIAWSKNGRVVQYLDGEVWAWDVRTKHVTRETIPIIDGVRGIANHGPTATLFTLGPEHTVQQYDVENKATVANVQHLPVGFQPLPSKDSLSKTTKTPQNSQPSSNMTEMGHASATRRTPFKTDEVEALRRLPSDATITSDRTDSVSPKLNSGNSKTVPITPPIKSAQSGTTFSLNSVSRGASPIPSGTSLDCSSSASLSSAKGPRTGSRLKNEVQFSPADKAPVDLFPSTRARLNDVPYRQQRPLDESYLTPDDLRRQMLSIVFGWDGDIEDLIKDEKSHHSVGSQSAILLAQWLGESDTDQMVSSINAGPISISDWMAFAFSQMTGQTQANKNIGQAFVQKLLEMGDVHTAAAILLGFEELDDAIEVYVSRNNFMEAIILTCLLMPSDWQRQSYLVRRWGEEALSQSERQLAIRCLTCVGVEPAEPATSLTAQQVNSLAELASMPSTEPSNPPYASAMNSPPLDSYPKLATKNNPPPKTPSLKLITSFDAHNDRKFRFPGLKSVNQTPTNMPGVTPIAESAVAESALTPGGLGPTGIQNLNLGRTTTPAFTRGRLSAIGETPVDVNPPVFPPSHAIQETAEVDPTGSEYDDNLNHSGEGLDTLLPSVKYDPTAESAEHKTPQTAIQTTPKYSNIKGPPPPRNELFTALGEQSRSQNGSRTRKPDGLEIHLPLSGYSQSLSQEEPTDSAQDLPGSVPSSRSPAESLNSYRSAASSSSAGGRSIDRYISSLEEANYRAQQHDIYRGNGEPYMYPHDVPQDHPGKSDFQHIQSTEQSPSYPVSMSSEEATQHKTDSDKLRGTAQTRQRASRTRNDGRVKKVDSGTRRRRRSSSRSTNSSRPEWSGRGESSSAMSSSSSSPNAITAGREEGVKDALRLVTVDRERLQSQQNGSQLHGAAGRNMSLGQGRLSPDAAHIGSRPSSRQNQLPGMAAPKLSLNEAGEEAPASGTSENFSELSSASSVHSRAMSWQRKKELAAAELEARRLSLAQKPSAPKIPFPGQTPSISNRPLNSIASQRANASMGKIPQISSPSDHPNSPEFGSFRPGASLGLPAASQTMRRPSNSNYNEQERDHVVSPNKHDQPAFLTNAKYSNEPEKISRSMSVPTPQQQPTEVPMHPRYNPNIPRSRSSSRPREIGHSRDTGTSLPVTVSIEGTLQNAGTKNTALGPDSTHQRNQKPENQQQQPPILPELQHLAATSLPPPPPLPPSRQGPSDASPRDSIGTINIAIEDAQDNAGPESYPRAMTAAPPAAAENPPRLARRLSFDHHHWRDRNINGSFSSVVRNFTGRRMRSNSRSGGGGGGSGGMGTQSPFGDSQLVKGRT